MNKWLIVLVAVVAFGWMYKKKSTKQASGFIAEHITTEADPCVGKDICVVTYVAPWCPACRQAVPQLLDITRKQWRDSQTRGMKFIVGADEPSKSEAYAKQIGELAYVDEGDEFRKKMNVEVFPTIWIVDKEQKILESGRDSIGWLNKDLSSNP